VSVRLHINIDHVATVRNARGENYPDPVLAAELCELAGADGITAHLREDRRHIRDDDVVRLRGAVRTLLNLEMAATGEMIAIAERVRPDVITLVPERREERTTEGGLDVRKQRAAIEQAVAMAERASIKVSLFIAADEDAVIASREVGARQVELHTGEYCHAARASGAPASGGVLSSEGAPPAFGGSAREIERLRSAAAKAKSLGLEVAAGHGLTRHNVGPVVAIREIEEVNIGHSVIADAIFFGLDRAVRDLRAAIERARR
jgi:pyridoxine 5-phosphate synthase